MAMTTACANELEERASIETPRRTTPWIVGKRGSCQPSTRPSSTNHASLRFDMTVCTKLTRANAWMCTGRSFSAACSHLYWSSRSLYSVVRSACVTPSRRGQTGRRRVARVFAACVRVPRS